MCLKSIIKDEGGLSLIEVALVLLIAGILTVPMIEMYNASKIKKTYDTTTRNLGYTLSAINKFANEQGHYPVPASFAAVNGDPTFGREGNPDPNLCTGAWFATDGMCKTTAPREVLIGSVPFNAIGLEEEESLDGWGHRILYAVSLTQTSAGTYVENNGAVGGAITAMVMTSGVLAPSPDGLMDMALISHGENGVGAYTADGVLATPCNAPMVEYEDENCNLDDVFVMNEDIKSLVTGGTYFDDEAMFVRTPQAGQWAQPPEATNNDITWTGGSRLGIGTTNPSAKVEVAGAVTATGKIRTDQMCNDGSSCFDPEMITGTLTAMDCSKKSALGGAVTGLVNSSVNCSGSVDSSGNPAGADIVPYYFDSTYITPTNCADTGRLMVGIDSTGAPICVTP